MFNEATFREILLPSSGNVNVLLYVYNCLQYFNTSVKDTTTCVSSWESKGLSNEKISSVITPGYNKA